MQGRFLACFGSDAILLVRYGFVLVRGEILEEEFKFIVLPRTVFEDMEAKTDTRHV